MEVSKESTRNPPGAHGGMLPLCFESCFSVTPIAIRGSGCQKHIVKLIMFAESVTKTHSEIATF